MKTALPIALAAVLVAPQGMANATHAHEEPRSRPSAPEGRTAADAPFDARFIDAMIPHHEQAVVMARRALVEAEHAELRAMAQEIVDSQQAEIDRMRAWRTSWHPSLAATEGLPMPGPGHAGHGVGEAAGRPHDERFIDMMIPHHQDAVVMSREALEKAEHEEIRQLARTIIDAQQAEIDTMTRWRREWYGR